MNAQLRQQNNKPMSFPELMQQMRGQDPNQILQNMIQNGQITQDQLNQVQVQANQMRGQFDQFKAMFGF